MPHQIPQYQQGRFVTQYNGDTEQDLPCPIEDFTAPLDTLHDHTIEQGFFARMVELHAPAATEWTGPFRTLNEAKAHILETFEVDPDTGEETTTIDPEEAQSAFFPKNGILQQSNRQVLEWSCQTVEYDEREGTITVDAPSAPEAIRLINATTDYPLLDDEDYSNREMELKEAAIADLPIRQWLDKLSPTESDYQDAYDDMPKHVKVPSVIDRLYRLTQAETTHSDVSEMLRHFEEGMSEYNDGWNGSQIDYSEATLFKYFKAAVEAVGLRRAATIMGYFDTAEVEPKDHSSLVKAFEEVHGPGRVDIRDTPAVAALRTQVYETESGS